jgi:multiple sugar transport system substrate-binding protein
MAALLVAGCAKTADKPRRLTFWAMGREGDAVRLLLPAFERQYPGVRVSVQTLPWAGAQQKLLSAFAGGSTPDVCQLGNTWIPELAQVHALVPLNARVKTSPAIDAADYFPGIWDTNRIGGTLYGVPWYVDTRLLFYRRDLLKKAGFDEAPRTWAEWANQMAAIKAMAGPKGYAVLLPLNEFEPLVTLGLQQNEPLLRDGSMYGNFQSRGFRRALRFYAEIFRKKWAPLAESTEISSLTDFAHGYFTFFISGPWTIAQLERKMPKNLRNAWAAAPMPGPQGPGASIAGGSSLVIFRASHHKRLAWELIKYLSTPAVEDKFYRLVGDLPPRRTAWENSNLAGDPHALPFRLQLERAKPVAKVPEWQHIASEISLIAERLAAGQLTVDQAAAELNRRADAILAKRRWVLGRNGGK